MSSRFIHLLRLIKRQVNKALIIFLLSFFSFAYIASAKENKKIDKVYKFNIPSQSLSESLNSLSDIARISFLFPYDLVENKQGNSIRGQYTVQQALNLLLDGSNLKGELSNHKAFLIKPLAIKKENKKSFEVKEMKTKKTLLASIFSVLFASNTTQAQQTNTDSVEEDTTGVEVIMVTAQKRAQNLQEVPASVSVVTGDTMAATGALSGTDISKYTPGITMYVDQDPRTTRFSVRGISGSANLSAVEPSASVIIDGETLPRPAALNMDLADVDRVEVLRGPQGTLFGKNASAGALHIVTKRPELGEFAANVNLTIAEDNEYITRATVNMPVNDETAVRVNGYYLDRGGWIPNLNSAEPDGGQKESYGVRGQLLYKPSEQFELLIRAEASHEDFGPFAKVLTGLPVDALTAESVEALEISGDLGVIGPNNRTTSQIGDRNYGELDNRAFSYEARYSMADYDVVYAGSWRDWQLFSNEDQSLVAVNVVPCYFCGDTNMETIQQELRLESTGNGPINYVAGLFYNKQEIFRSETWTECIVFPGGLPAGTVINRQTLNITDCGGSGRPNNLFDNTMRSLLTVDYFAAFGNVEWKLSDKVNVFAGARILTEEQELTYEGGMENVPFFTATTDDDAIIGRAGAQYFVNDDVMFYGSVATGYKGKGWDNGIGSSRAFIEDNFPIKAEKPTQFELGVKGDFFDNMLRTNLTLFRVDVRDYQDSSEVPDSSNPSGRVRRLQSAGDVRSEGAELEITALITEDFKISGFFAYADVFFTTDTYTGCSALSESQGICQDLNFLTSDGTTTTARLANRKDQQLPNSVKLSYNLSATYNYDLPGEYYGFARVDYRWQDDQDFAFNDPTQRRDDFGVANLSLNVTSPDDEWSLTFFINNLFDQEYTERTTISHFGGYAGGSSATIPRDYKRYMGASLNINF